MSAPERRGGAQAKFRFLQVAPSGEPAGLILVDYDNTLRECASGAELRHEIIALAQRVLLEREDVEYVLVRLYGGWRRDGELTKRASEILAWLGESVIFPVSHPIGGGILRGDVELAYSLLAFPSHRLDDTYRRRLSPPTLRLSGDGPLPDGCVAADHEECPAFAMAKFTKSHSKMCPAASCGVTAGDAFEVFEQKMVDTLLTCDLLAGVEVGLFDLVALSSGDGDFVPPLIFAAVASVGCSILWLNAEDGASEESVELLRENGVLC